MSCHVLITGGQGFIGRYLSAFWLEKHPDTLVLSVGRSKREDRYFAHDVTRGDTAVPAPIPEIIRQTVSSNRYRHQSLDILDLTALTRLIRDFSPTVVVHLAGALRDEPADRLFRSNVEATVSLLEALSGSGIPLPRVVFGSSGGVYGKPSDADLPLRETRTGNPVDIYSASKLAAENVSGILCERYGVPAVWARIFNVVGPGQEERHFCGWVAAQAAAVSAGERDPVFEVGNLDTTRDFIDVRDVAAALHTLGTDRRLSGTFNVASGVETPIREAFKRTLKAAGIEQQVTIRRRRDRPADIPRHFADISRIRAAGFRTEHPLSGSIGDVLEYYRTCVRRPAARIRIMEQTEPQPLRVSVSESHRYDVTIAPGVMAGLPGRLRSLFPRSRMVVLTDDRVRDLYADVLVERMKTEGIATAVASLPVGEPSKSLEASRRLIETLHDERFDRRAVLVNVGGGLVTDVGGFVAATYMRGVAYINIPTTLLAQHDAAIGGKVALNMPWAKNFVGAFHHPCAVFVDPCVLKTLEDRDIASGAAEAVKVAITGDRTLFELLEQEATGILKKRDPDILATVVRRATRQKIRLLDPDPYEVDLRRALNLGHTFGHPLETELAYEGIRHGEAVGYGIAVATEVAKQRGACSNENAERILRLLRTYRLPPRVPLPRLLAACERLQEVRLVRAMKLHFVLPTGIDSVDIVDEVEDRELRGAIEALARHPLVGGDAGPSASSETGRRSGTA